MQVLAEYWSFLPGEERQSAFPNKRVFVNGLLATPEMVLSQPDTLGLLIHRHEPEVSAKLLVVHVPLLVVYGWWVFKCYSLFFKHMCLQVLKSEGCNDNLNRNNNTNYRCLKRWGA